MPVAIFRDADWLLSEEAFSLYAPCMYRPVYEDYRARMEGFLTDPSVKVFVCEDQGRKTGMMVLKYDGTDAEIIGIAVSEASRRRGMGRKLIQNALGSGDLERIKAETDGESIGFYRKCGFEEERRVIKYPDGPAVRYACVLGNRRPPACRV